MSLSPAAEPGSGSPNSPPSSTARPRRRRMRPDGRCVCPDCGSDRTHGHGSFPLKDGSRQPRQMCRACGRTFNRHTGTPLAYLKKRDRWAMLGRAMAVGLSVRRTAAALGIHPTTAFRWRHRLLLPLAGVPQPTLAGSVAASEAYIPYSEKGNRLNPGFRRRGARPSATPAVPVSGGSAGPHITADGHGPDKPRRRFRRLVDRKPACMLLACSDEQKATAMISRGRPGLEALHSCLSELLKAGAEVWAQGLAPYAQVCRRLGVSCRDAQAAGPGIRSVTASWSVDRLRAQLYNWLRKFRGVATRYLPNYLAWHRFAGPEASRQPREAGEALLANADALPSG